MLYARRTDYARGYLPGRSGQSERARVHVGRPFARVPPCTTNYTVGVRSQRPLKKGIGESARERTRTNANGRETDATHDYRCGWTPTDGGPVERENVFFFFFYRFRLYLLCIGTYAVQSDSRFCQSWDRFENIFQNLRSRYFFFFRLNPIRHENEWLKG